MANRFSDISRGPELADAYEKLEAWRKLSKAEKKARYTAVKKTTARVKPVRTKAYIVAFSAARNDIYFESFVPAALTGPGSEAAGIVRTLIATRYVTNAPTGETTTIFKVPKFKFAQVRASKNVGTPVVNAVSRMTGRPYTRISTESVSGNFGQVAGATSYEAAVKAMKAIENFAAFDNAAGQSISFKPEGV